MTIQILDWATEGGIATHSSSHGSNGKQTKQEITGKRNECPVLVGDCCVASADGGSGDDGRFHHQCLD